MRVLTALLVALTVLSSGCTQVVPGIGVAAGPPDPSVPVDVASPGDAGAAAEAAITAVQDFWRAEFPALGGQWTDVATFAGISPAAADPPPCVERAADVADQAYYCPSADAVVWDADGLVPALFDEFGHVGVLVVLAHEIGHAVQSRLGIDSAQARDPQRYPTILLEAMADCYTGVALRGLADRPVAGLPVGPVERDAALRTLVGFRDPLGVAAGDEGAHGNAFDRLSAFQAGYEGGSGRCAAMTVPERGFTQVRFGSADDLARAGDLPLRDLLTAVERDARAWATELASARAPGWNAPPLTVDVCPDAAAQGPARLCLGPSGPAGVDVEIAELTPLHRELGDFAGATLLSGRYALAALAATGTAVEGAGAGHAAVCLAGAYAGRLLLAPDGFRLSPGDLDEAVQVLLTDDTAARDVLGRSDPAERGYERVARYEVGLRGGPAACAV
ncbi:neutral zinc metallopeptidase [Pseudonocardia sp.]|uniref:neutral zinc metallopeptidase n=1 Tax=Pseudonocardia sp. TaxID=60912 RepID=UPI00263064AB|nr:neutral zinc metallopeptidase [Pseudonocardia sp.]